MADKEPTLRELWRVFRARFAEDRCPETAASLTFMTLLAIVPTITVAFTIATAAPRFRALLEELREFLVLNVLPESVNVVSVYAEQFLENATHLTSLGVIVIGGSALFLVLTIDRAFNHIWHVSRQRPLLRRVLMYCMILTVGPLLVGASVSLSSYLLALPFSKVSEVSAMKVAVLRFLPLVLTTAALGLLYLAVPNCAVHKRDAFVGAIVAGALFEVMKHAFGIYVAHFPTYTLVYGAFATLPIFFFGFTYLGWSLSAVPS